MTWTNMVHPSRRPWPTLRRPMIGGTSRTVDPYGGDMTVIDLYERLLTAWNDRDAAAFAALFAGDGVSIGFDGSQSTGPEIQAHLEPIFGDHPTAAFVA